MTSANSSYGLVPDVIYTFSDGWNQAQALAEKCGAALGLIDVHRFPDGESLITAPPEARAAGGTVALYRSLYDPNAKLTEVMLAAQAIRTLGAKTLILIAPYLPYMRQDKAFAPGQAVSQSALGAYLGGIFDTIVTIEAHLHRTSSLDHVFAPAQVLVIGAGHAIAQSLRNHTSIPTVVVGPDEESEHLIKEVVEILGTSWFTARKVRHGDNDVKVTLPPDLKIEGHPVVIVDDIISSGGTVAELAKALKHAGAGAISAYAVHALFDQRAAFVMRRAGVSEIKSMSTIPHTTNAIDIVDLLCGALGMHK